MCMVCSLWAAWSKTDSFNSQDIANALWALATMKVQQPELVDQLCNIKLYFSRVLKG